MEAARVRVGLRYVRIDGRRVSSSSVGHQHWAMGRLRRLRLLRLRLRPASLCARPTAGCRIIGEHRFVVLESWPGLRTPLRGRTGESRTVTNRKCIRTFLFHRYVSRECVGRSTLSYVGLGLSRGSPSLILIEKVRLCCCGTFAECRINRDGGCVRSSGTLAKAL